MPNQKPTVKELKKFIIANRSKSDKKILVTGLRKRELYDIAYQLGYPST